MLLAEIFKIIYPWNNFHSFQNIVWEGGGMKMR